MSSECIKVLDNDAETINLAMNEAEATATILIMWIFSVIGIIVEVNRNILNNG